MNAVGVIGELIIEYQYEIEIGLLVLLGLIILFAVIRAFVRAARRKTLLEEISGKVDEISEALNAMAAEPEQKHSEQKPSAEKTPEVCKVAEAQPAGKPAEGEKPVKKETAGAVETTVSAREAEPPEAAEVLPFKAESPADAPDSGAADFVPKKYFSRDCSVDKKGNRYTLEELEEQIK